MDDYYAQTVGRNSIFSYYCLYLFHWLDGILHWKTTKTSHKGDRKKINCLRNANRISFRGRNELGNNTQQDLNQALNVVNLKASMKKMKGELLYASCANSTTHTFTKEKNVTHSSLSKFDLITLEDTLTNRRMNT